LAVNLIVDFAAGRFGEADSVRALEAAEARGFRLVHAPGADERLAAWIDWRFAPSWWSAETRAGEAWYALDARGEIAGFAAFDARGLRFPWLRGYAQQADLGLFGPYGVAPEHRKSGLGAALLDLALCSLRRKGYARALIPAVGYDRLIAMYEARAGARVADRYSYDSPRRYRAVILASGGGTNAQNVFDRVAAGTLPLELGAVIANSASAEVIGRAERAGVLVRTVVWDRAGETRAAYDARVIAAVEASRPELVLLLGWMHLLPPAFIERFGEILNVHPAFLPFDPRADDVVLPDGSSLPAFRGARAMQQTLAARAVWSGASVHRVTAQTDRGAIVVRTPLRLDAVPSLLELAATLRPIEHAAVAAAIRRWCFERGAGPEC
jgi:folate-dependent phosphoribosylglycinamide formyltransferase PurN/L-amino acid N-acyltransferase YncA